MRTDSRPYADELHKPAYTLTVADLRRLIREEIRSTRTEADEELRNEIREAKEMKGYEYGIAGVARTFGCGQTKAKQILASGVIDDAVTRTGRRIMIDKEHAIRLMKESNKTNN